MRKFLTYALIFGFCSPLLAQNKKISTSLKNEPIAVLFQQIQKQSGYNVVYSDEVIADSMLVTLTAERTPVAQILGEVLPQKQLFYKMLSDGLIVIGSYKGQVPNANGLTTSINGTVIDTKGNPIPFASIGLFEDDKVVGGNISSDAGLYRIAYHFMAQKAYLLKVSSVGFETLTVNFTYPDTTNLKQLTLKEGQHTLKTVNITGDKPLIERKTDRYIVNVEGSALANGNNGLEVLQKSPGIWVGSDGSIKIKGNQSVMVMINDVVQRMSESDLAEYLRTLRSEDISKIEIISSPPSEFEAAGSGGIIHIILKKTRRDGVTGNISSQYRQQEKRPAYSANTTINYKVKSLYLSGSFNAGKEESDFIATNKINYADLSTYASNTSRYNNNGRLMYRISGGYDISDKQSIGFQSIQTVNKLNQYFTTHINFANNSQPLTGLATSEWFRRPVMNGTTLNYSLKTDSLGSGLKVIADYVYSAKTELNNFASIYNLPTKNSTYRNNTPNRTDLYSIQTDFTKNYKSGLIFKQGLKFAATKRDNEVINENLIGGDWVLNTNLSNRFVYTEYLSMAYTSLEKAFNKLSMKIGLRAENTTMRGDLITKNEKFNRNYLSLFPSFFLTQKFDEKTNSVAYLSYSRRLQRPSFAYLNPYRLQFDDYLTQLGNPDLLPEYTHKMEIGATFWKNLSADVYYSITTNKMAQFANPVANNIIEYQPKNFDNSYEYGFSLNAPLKIAKWWAMNNSFAAFNLKYKLNDFKIQQTTFYVKTYNTFTFKNLFDLDISSDYRSPYVTSNTHYADYNSTDIGLSKRMANKSLLLRAYVSDIFNSNREKDQTTFAGTTIDFYQKRPTRTFMLYLSYSFSSGKKFSNKKIEQSNDEEKNRIGN